LSKVFAMAVVTTIVPIFAVIFLGAVARQRGFIPDSFLAPANRLVYYLAIPAMIFRAVATTSLKLNFNAGLLTATLIVVGMGFAVAWGLAPLMVARRPHRGTFVQCGFHGNIGYVGLAVVFYYLGDKGLAPACILAGFVFILQNVLAVLVLVYYAPMGFADTGSGPRRVRMMAQTILGNPVIFSSLAGMAYAAMELPLPVVVERTLTMLGNMALPTALLLIGASLSFGVVTHHIKTLAAVNLVKLVGMPAAGWLLYRMLGIPGEIFMPGLIILATPTATMTYVMANEIGGDAEFAVATVSVGTLLSALTFTLWLQLALPGG
jgi:predicted permease